MRTVGNVAGAMKLPEGAVVHYVPAEWASAAAQVRTDDGAQAGRSGRGEEIGTGTARLEAYEQLRQMMSWLRLPLVDEGDKGDESGY